MAETNKTRAQLAEENATLRARVAELEAETPTPGSARRPMMPSFGLSEGTRLDILEAQNTIRTHPRLTEVRLVEPFTGATIIVTEDGHQVDEGLDATTPEAPVTDPAAADENPV
jgi:hypothetical protein